MYCLSASTRATFRSTLMRETKMKNEQKANAFTIALKIYFYTEVETFRMKLGA